VGANAEGKKKARVASLRSGVWERVSAHWREDE